MIAEMGIFIRQFKPVILGVILWIYTCGLVFANQDVAHYLEELHKFDISCKIVDERFKKKTVALKHCAVFRSLVHTSDKKAVLAEVESTQAASREQVKMIQKLLADAPSVDLKKKRLYREWVALAQGGDFHALEQLMSAGPAAIPAILPLADERDTIPSQAIINVLTLLEQQADKKLSARSPDLDRDVLSALLLREKNYGEILKRAVLALEGTRRPLPYWLPFIYMYGLGFIPFLAGIIASVIYYDGVQPRVMWLLAGSYLFYVALIGFFQFFAPWMN